VASETEVNVRDVVMSELQRNVVSPLELRTIAREIQDFAEGLEDNDRKFFHQDDPRVVFQCVDSDERSKLGCRSRLEPANGLRSRDAKHSLRA